MAYDSTRIMDLLKESTDQQHRDAERRRLQKSMVQGRLSADRYRLWLGQMYLLHDKLWTEIAERREGEPVLASIVQDEGCHVAHLEADLAALGAQPSAIETLPATAAAIEAIGRTAEARPLALLGYNYVLEGSMNGNRYIAKALVHSVGATATTYLDPYGEQQRPTWLAYRERMNDAGFSAEQANEMVAAAQDMFMFVAEMSDAVMDVPVPA